MNEETLPPSPNWYLTTILDVASDGTVAYGAKNSVVILDPPSEGSSKMTRAVRIIQVAHKDKVNVVKFGTQHEHKDKIATVGGDSYVKIWDTLTLQPYLAHQAHKDGVKLVGMDWSTADPQLVVSVDDSGVLAMLDLASRTTQTIQVYKLHASILACCPHRRQWVAVGDTVGLVNIVNITGSGSVVHRMRGHDTVVVSLSWCPALGNALRGDGDPGEMLLASGAKNRSVYVWRAGTDGRYQTVLELPSSPQQQQQQQQHRTTLSGATGTATPGCWAATSWPEPTKLITASMWGETLVWDMRLIADKQKKTNQSLTKVKAVVACRLLTAVHGRGLFSIACGGKTGTEAAANIVAEPSAASWRKPQAAEKHEVPKAADTLPPVPSNWRSPPILEAGPATLVWTTGQDRQLVCASLATGAIELALPTLGGFVYCVAVSELDSYKVAVGVGDGSIRVWNLADLGRVDIKQMWMKINGKVSSLAWHPGKETWLAYGTSDGRVGIYDTASPGKGPVRLWSHHHNTVYSLGWGPPTYKKGEENPFKACAYTLYSNGDGELLQYNPDKRDYCVNIMKTIAGITKKTHYCEFKWKQDCSLLAIGTDTGCVLLCQPPHLVVLATVYPHKKVIHCLAWHPLTTATEPDGSPARHCMAFGSTITEVKIYDFAPLFKGVTTALDAEACVATLTGHTERVTSVAWSPHISRQLVTTSYDNTAMVWDVRDGGKLLAVYTAHSSWVYSSMWCPLDADMVMTGSGDFTLRVWRISKQQTVRPGKKQLHSHSQLTLATPLLTPHEEPKPVADRPSQPIKGGAMPDGTSKRSYFPLSSRARNLGKESLVRSSYALLKAVDNRKSQLQQAETNGVENVTKSETADRSDVDKLSNGEASKTEQREAAASLPADFFHMGFFTDSDAMRQLLQMEESELVKNNNNAYAQELHLWRAASFLDVLEKAKREKKLTAWHIAMAPTVSPRVWREMSLAYAAQLTELGRTHEAASMLLATRQPREAVKLLVNEKLYREAVAVARCQVNDEGATAGQVVAMWARHAEATGDYELAVHCLISGEDFERAAHLQSCRRDAASLQLAAHLALRARAANLAVKLGEAAVRKFLADEQYARAKEVVTEHQQLKTWWWLVVSYEEITLLRHAMAQHMNFNVHVWGWLRGERSTAAGTTTLVQRIAAGCDGAATDNVELMLRGLEAKPTTKQQFWLLVAGHVAASCMKESASDKLRHYIHALNACYQYEVLFPHSRVMVGLASWLLPQPHNVDEGYTSIDAYICLGIIHWVATLQHYAEEKPKENTELPPAKWSVLVGVLKSTLRSALDADALCYYQVNSDLEKYERAVAEARLKKTKDEGKKCDAVGVTTKEEGKKKKCDTVGVKAKGEEKKGDIVGVTMKEEKKSGDIVGVTTREEEKKGDIMGATMKEEESKGDTVDVLAGGDNSAAEDVAKTDKPRESVDEVLHSGDNVEEIQVMDGERENKAEICHSGQENGDRVVEVSDDMEKVAESVTLEQGDDKGSPVEGDNVDFVMLTKLHEFKSTFVRSRVSAPNPFLIYVQAKQVLEMQKESEGVAELLCLLEELWVAATAGAKDRWNQFESVLSIGSNIHIKF